MATHDYVIDNSTGANVRADINNVLQAILTNNSNSSTPTTTEAYMWWADTTANIFKIRNSANNAWINLFTLAGGIDVDAASSFNEDVSFLGANYQIVFDKSENAFEFGNDAKAKFGTDDDLEIFHESSSDTNLINSHKELKLFSNGNTTLFTNNAETMVKGIKNGAVELYHDNSKKFETESSGCKIDGSLELTANLIMSDDDKIRMGNSQDLEIFHSGGVNQILSGGANLKIGTSGETFAEFNNNGNVKLFHDNSLKFQTNTNGCRFVGILAGVDTDKLTLGTSNDLEIYHDGTNSYIQHGTSGNLRYQSGNHDFYNRVGDEFQCRMFQNGGVNLYFDHSQKLQTDTNGINVSGSVHGASTISTSNGNDASATFDRQGSSGTLVELRFGGANKGTISVDSSNAAFNTSASDRTLKKNFESWNENVLALFKNINPQKFNYIDQEDTDTKSKGFIAQDLVDGFPEAYPKNDEDKYMFNPSGMVVYLMKAIQELESKVAALEAA